MPETRGRYSSDADLRRSALSFRGTKEIVREFEKLEPSIRVSARGIKIGDVSPVVLLELEAQELHNLFWKLYRAIPGCPHTLIEGSYSPHLTLGGFQEKDRSAVIEYVRSASQDSTLKDLTFEISRPLLWF